MIAADFLGDPTGTGLDMPPKRTVRVAASVNEGNDCRPRIFWATHSRPAQPHGNFDLDRA
jgi:hypothetical protein